jgi:hypothetical protein
MRVRNGHPNKRRPARGSKRGGETVTDRETKIELPEELPKGLPVPEDDGAADHLPGKRLPSVALKSAAGDLVDLSALAGVTVAYEECSVARALYAGLGDLARDIGVGEILAQPVSYTDYPYEAGYLRCEPWWWLDTTRFTDRGDLLTS